MQSKTINFTELKKVCVTYPPTKFKMKSDGRGNTDWVGTLDLDAYCKCCNRFYWQMDEWQEELKKQQGTIK